MAEAAAVVEQSAADTEADQAFSAGFDEAPAQAATEQKPVESADTKTTEEGKTVAAPAEKPVLIGSMPEAEWNAAVAKAAAPAIEAARAETRKAFGQYGELKKTLTDLQGKLAAGGSTAVRKKLTADALKRVNEELPGMGDALAQDLSDFFDYDAEVATAKATAEAKGETFDAEAFFTTKIGPALEALEARANERAELRIVKSIHRDFDKVVKSAEFGTWLGTLPLEEQTLIRESEDGFVAADAVTAFKAAQEKANKGRAANQTRLEAALTPSGDRQPASHAQLDDEATFDHGFKTTK